MPKAPDLSEFRLRTGVLLGRDRGLVLAGHNVLDEENTAHTFQFMWRRDMEWSGRRQSWTSGAAGYLPSPVDTSITVGEDGNFYAWGDSVELEGRIANKGIFSSVKAIGKHAYVVGMSATVYRCDSLDTWTKLNLNLTRDVSFESITGPSESEMYAVGWEGVICCIKDNQSTLIESPTNLILNDACYGENGYVYCCGQKGILVKGRNENWEVIEQDVTTEDFWGIAFFKGNIYVSTASFLYSLKGDQLELVRFSDDLPKSFYHLSTFDDSYMWSIGPHDLMGFDGGNWERIL
jgi:hypothetical protein